MLWIWDYFHDKGQKGKVYSWIWDYFHDKGLLFQGQGLIAHKGIERSY